MVHKIFISYSSRYNKEIAGDIKRYFEEYEGIECFVAHDDIIPGSKWEKEIIEKLNSADFFMPIQTEYLEASYWCQQEAGYAIAKEIKIVPLIPDTEGTEPVGFYAKFQGFKIKTNDLKNSVKLWLIKENIIQEDEVSEIDKRIFLFANSNSFEEAGKTTKSLFEFENKFKKADILKIVDVTLSNDQILDSHSARPQLRRLFIEHSKIIPIEKLEKFLKYN